MSTIILPIQSRPRPSLLALPTNLASRPKTQYDGSYSNGSRSNIINANAIPPIIILSTNERHSRNPQRSTARIRHQIRTSTPEPTSPRRRHPIFRFFNPVRGRRQRSRNLHTNNHNQQRFRSQPKPKLQQIHRPAGLWSTPHISRHIHRKHSKLSNTNLYPRHNPRPTPHSHPPTPIPF